MLEPLSHTAAWATQTYDVTRTWLATMLVVAVIPPVASYLYRHRWQFSLRHLLGGAITLAVVLAWLRSDFESFRLYRSDIQGHLYTPGEWWYAVPILIISSLVTWAQTRSPDTDQSASRDT